MLMQCGGNDQPSCGELESGAWSAVQATVDGTDHACTEDSDCTLGDYYPSCMRGACNTVVALTSSATHAVEQGVAKATASYCTTFSDRECQFIVTPCVIRGAPIAVCADNLCQVKYTE
jgi:hypothetical protein